MDVEQRGWRSISRGGTRRLVAVIHRGHCCPGTAGMGLEGPEGYRGKGGFPGSPAKAKGLLCPREDKSVPGL